MKAIATLTMNPALDVSAKVLEVVPTYKLRCSDSRREPGGGGINVARAIHRLGGKAVPLYIAGGATGQMLHKLLRREGIEDRTVEIEKLTRESFMVFETSTGRQFRFVLPGPEIRKGEWQQCLDMLGLLTPIPAYVVASGSLPPGVPSDFYARVAETAQRIGARLIVDTSGPPCAPPWSRASSWPSPTSGSWKRSSAVPSTIRRPRRRPAGNSSPAAAAKPWLSLSGNGAPSWPPRRGSGAHHLSM